MTDATSSADPLAYNEDGSAKDPIAFRDALMADPEKRAAIEQDKELAAVLLSDDTAKIQDVLRRLYAQQVRAEERRANVTLNSSDILRAQCPTPRDPTALYENMLKVGLQYGPAFRLLSQVWIPDEVAAEQQNANTSA